MYCMKGYAKQILNTILIRWSSFKLIILILYALIISMIYLKIIIINKPFFDRKLIRKIQVKLKKIIMRTDIFKSGYKTCVYYLIAKKD